MKKTLLILGAVIVALSGALLIGVFFFFVFAGFSQDAVMLESRSALTQDSRAPADVAVLEREESAPQSEPAAKVASSSQKVALAAPVPNVSFADDAKVIRNGALTLVVESPVTAVAGVEQIIAGIPGAFVATADVRQAGDLQPTALTLRVPAAAFDQAMSALRALAEEVLAEQVTAPRRN